MIETEVTSLHRNTWINTKSCATLSNIVFFLFFNNSTTKLELVKVMTSEPLVCGVLYDIQCYFFSLVYVTDIVLNKQ